MKIRLDPSLGTLNQQDWNSSPRQNNSIPQDSFFYRILAVKAVADLLEQAERREH
jgi:hypothetical protein